MVGVRFLPVSRAGSGRKRWAQSEGRARTSWELPGPLYVSLTSKEGDSKVSSVNIATCVLIASLFY